MFNAVHNVSWLTCLIWLDIEQCYRKVVLACGARQRMKDAVALADM